MERNRTGRDINVNEMEPSAEFPILFGLLTERRKGHSASPVRQIIQHPTRRAVIASNSTSPNISTVEPDSSTPDDDTDDTSTVTNSQSVTPNPQYHQQHHQSSSHGSPLLILRLTSNRTDVNHQNTISCNRQRSNHGQEFQVIQQQQRPRRHTNFKVISKNDDCTPSSTTTDDEESPYKRCRMSLPTVTISNSVDSSKAVSLSSYNFPGSSSQLARVTCSTTFVSQEDDSATSHFAYHDAGTQPYAEPPTFENEASSSSVFFSRSESDRPYYTCNVCDLKFKRQFHLLRHVAIHEDKRGFRCCHCHTAFYRKDNLLVHQGSCQQKTCGMRRTMMVQPHSQQQRPSRPPPRTLADLLDRQDDDYYGKYRDDSLLSSFVKLPSGLEISEVEVPFQKSSTEVEEIQHSKIDIPTAPLQNHHRAGTTVETSDFNEAVYPCGYCHKMFASLSHLLKHTANHIKNPADGTFHFEIETRI